MKSINISLLFLCEHLPETIYSVGGLKGEGIPVKECVCVCVRGCVCVLGGVGVCVCVCVCVLGGLGVQISRIFNVMLSAFLWIQVQKAFGSKSCARYFEYHCVFLF